MTARTMSDMTPYSPAYWMAADQPPAMRPLVRLWRMHVVGRGGEWVAGVTVGVVAFSVALLAFRWALVA